MKKKPLFLSLSILLSSSIFAQADDYKLEQALILSRHNLRAPIAEGEPLLLRSTPNTWPKWKTKSNNLTTKGGVLEVYMGHYFDVWFQKDGLLPTSGCPAKDTIYIYANRFQRTVATAQFFTAGAFPACDITVSHLEISEKETEATIDPIFNLAFTKEDNAFREASQKEINDKLSALNLTTSYHLLEEIIDYKNSSVCLKDKQCSLSKEKNIFTADLGKAPRINGPLTSAAFIVETMMLQYYEGFPLDQIAWRKSISSKQWQELMLIRGSLQDIQFSSPIVARNLAKPLVLYINTALIETPKDKAPKVTVLVGHDANIASLLSALQVEPYQLPHQYEITPIGGKVVFQRWNNKSTNQDFLKVEYVYQSTEQIRNATELTLTTPPQRVTLFFKGCPTNAQGFCPWSDFEKILKAAQQ